MLTDPKAIEIISGARQANVRDPKRSREHFIRIFDDFLWDTDLFDAVVLDIGPGQFDFCELAKEQSALPSAIDKDPAVVELGKYLGFPTVQGDIRDISEYFSEATFDGLFCKFSINAMWFKTPQEVAEHVRSVCSLLKPGGWGWIAPWNGRPNDNRLDSVSELIAAQRTAFEQEGFAHCSLSEEQTRHYGVHGSTVDRPLFVRNLTFDVLSVVP